MGSSAHTAGNATSTKAQDHDRGGMVPVDTSGNTRIPILMDMVSALSRATSPQDVLKEFSAGIRQLQERDAYVSLSTRELSEGDYRITRMILGDDMAAHLASTDPWRDRDKIPVHRGGFLGEIIRKGCPQILHNVYLKDDPVIGNALAEFGSFMAVPLFDNGEPLNWAIIVRRGREGFTVQELEDTILRGNLIGSSIRNVLANQKLREANRQIQHEVEHIAKIQRALLPSVLPAIENVAIGASYQTFDTAGGDLYDFVPLRTGEDNEPDPKGPWLIHIADAAGHGPAAATVVAMLNAILAASPEGMHGPGELLTFANRHLYAKRLDGTFVTAILACYDPATRQLTYARAGHNPALLMTVREDRVRLERLEEAGGIPLGVLDDTQYDEDTVQLEAGQTLVLYTDGITEAMAPDGTQFEVDGIERSLTECSGYPECVIGHVTEALCEHQAGRRPADDQTLLVLRFG